MNARTRRLTAVCKLIVLLSALPFPAENPSRLEMDLAVLRLMDAAVRSDDRGLDEARSRLEQILSEMVSAGDRSAIAPARFHLALGAWLRTSIGTRTADPAALIDEALRDLDQAIEADPNLAEAHMLAAMCHVSRYRFGVARPDTGAAIGRSVKRALEVGADDPRVGMFEGLMRAFDPNGPARPEGVKRLEEVCAALDRERREHPRVANWWDTNSLVWLATVYLADESPDVAKARAAIERALDLRPDCAQARALLGATELREFASAELLRDVRWRRLAEDPAGDGKRPAYPDARALYASSDLVDGRRWFRFELDGPVPSRSVGVNLVLDVDGDQTNGSPWWGGRTDFRFDRLVTVWITSTDAVRYRGYVGVADARDASAGQLTTIARNDVDVAIDAARRSVLIGVRESDLGTTPKTVMLGVVGSSLLWNDEIAVR